MNQSRQVTRAGLTKKPAKRKLKRQVRTGLLLGVAVLLSCFLLGAGKEAEKLTGNPTTVSTPAQLQQTPAIQEKQKSSGVLTATNTTATAPSQASASEPWKLVLVNPWHTLPADYKVDLTKLKNGQAVDERCYPSLQSMLDDCREAGLNPVICSSYRTQEKQEKLFNKKVNKFTTQGYVLEKAKAEAGKVVAVPGTSEHQLGLAVDIVDLANQNLDESQENTAVQKWLAQNSWQYGFILRYPNDKSELTGIIYEPWHYRYVGKTAARQIYEQGICLEEYLSQQNQN